ncbi:D-alanyl-D-alanine carboxypeptidase/D-alanyl-D-alanine-endopeptidase (penicillin-binding protein 4) [Volucribacter psittacicida]|uniref:D-alanyl-D-alanine carboxypeptidase/D-alanyl-D-alanine-endopeptidase (Penicillin-binding protein 4) n=2 Tax=Volucribacter psittacicida TaxID=203482 RepID=A0A4V6NCV0_9PAST|nr:D-alanyl-D-alanine carboxypeptidase/D-alanyl-D-alanine-endopeptidase (penicillin-binding protein 4) [Volucribacter psittacicida]
MAIIVTHFFINNAIIIFRDFLDVSTIMNKLLKFSFLLATLLPSHFALADAQSLTSQLPAGTNLAFIAKNIPQNKIIDQYHADLFMLPASTQKVLTALTAKLFLPDNFRFNTNLLRQGEIKNGVLRGNLVIQFHGDPDLTSGQLYQLLAKLKQQGIEKIDGDLILDSAIFASHDRAPGWIWNDLTMCFNAPPAAINLDNNCFYVNLDANYPVGELAKFHVPANFPVQVFGQVRIVDNKEANYCQLDAVVHDNNRYQIKGCIRRQNKPFGLSFAVQDPDSYGIAVVQRQLNQLGITFTGQVKQAITPQQGQLLAEHQSASLAELIKKMMKKSDNQIADALFRAIAYQYYKRPATFQLGSLAMKQILQSKANISLGNAIIADGSGLSRHNLISVQDMLKVLDYIITHEDQLQLLESFPTAGVDGTLSGRGSMLNPPLVKNIKAKTGALKGVYNLAGFMTNARGETVAFVQFINGYSTGELDSKTKRSPLNRFENQLYNDLYQQ